MSSIEPKVSSCVHVIYGQRWKLLRVVVEKPSRLVEGSPALFSERHNWDSEYRFGTEISLKVIQSWKWTETLCLRGTCPQTGYGFEVSYAGNYAWVRQAVALGLLEWPGDDWEAYLSFCNVLPRWRKETENPAVVDVEIRNLQQVVVAETARANREFVPEDAVVIKLIGNYYPHEAVAEDVEVVAGASLAGPNFSGCVEAFSQTSHRLLRVVVGKPSMLLASKLTNDLPAWDYDHGLESEIPLSVIRSWKWTERLHLCGICPETGRNFRVVDAGRYAWIRQAIALELLEWPGNDWEAYLLFLGEDIMSCWKAEIGKPVALDAEMGRLQEQVMAGNGTKRSTPENARVINLLGENERREEDEHEDMKRDILGSMYGSDEEENVGEGE